MEKGWSTAGLKKRLAGNPFQRHVIPTAPVEKEQKQ
jgi:hypothetical protein